MATQRQINPNLNKMFEWSDAGPIYFDCVPRRFDFIKGCALQTAAAITETYGGRPHMEINLHGFNGAFAEHRR